LTSQAQVIKTQLPNPPPPIEALLETVHAAIAELKAKDVVEIDVRGKSSVTDYMVIASGTSSRHVKSIADEVVRFAKKLDVMPLGVEGEREAEWVLVDLGDVIVHIMLPRIREFYGEDAAASPDYGRIATERHAARFERLLAGQRIHYGGRVDVAQRYVEPTIVKARSARDRIAQEEVFGPFVTVLTFKDDAEALAIANGTDYGLGSGLWTRDLQRAHRFARELHAGMVWINDHSYSHGAMQCSWGGVKESGIGREMGREGLDGFVELKSVAVSGPSLG